MWPLVTYPNYFETVSTVINQTHFQVAYCMVAIICAASGFEISAS